MSETAARRGARIRTPDQRLRVFVSSTLGELADERKAARRAIERLSAAPVMFELGARPHPPRSLYRAYLEQSDIFVGIYWEKYGWVAPGENVSGLEDEYNLAPAGMPKLMYFKQPTGSREPALERLLSRIRNDDTASYKHFRDAKELARLIVTDLAVLLAERFDDSRMPPGPRTGATLFPDEPVPVPAAGYGLPAPLTRLFGREDDISRIHELLHSPGVRLVTLIGPGGIGKTRLAIEAARASARTFAEVVFVPLAPIDDPGQVPGAIAQALGVVDTGDAPLEQKLPLALGERRILLILDNFEQVVEAAPVVTAILAGAPEVKVLATSRLLLKVAGEHSYEVPPLGLPADRLRPWEPGQRVAPSVEMFVERARSVKPDLELTPHNIEAIERIVARVEGLPLAIELAAARTRMLAPPALLDKLQRQLAVLTGGHRDAPERHRTVRNTIEWSARLLPEHERDLLWRLGVFAGRFSLEAVEAVAEPGADVLELLEPLVDASLVRQQEVDGRSYFRLLATVREYALEQLETSNSLAWVRERHASYYVDWSTRVAARLFSAEGTTSKQLLESEIDNLRAAIRWLLDAREWERATRVVSDLAFFWWMANLMGEVSKWMKEALAAGEPLSDRARGVALSLAASFGFFHQDFTSVSEQLKESVEVLKRTDEPVGQWFSLWSLAVTEAAGGNVSRAKTTMNESLEAARRTSIPVVESMALVELGRLFLAERDLPSAAAAFDEAVRITPGSIDPSLPFALNHLGWTRLFEHRLHDATALMLRGLDLSVELDHHQAIAHGLEGFLAIAAARGEIENAGRLAGAARTLRERTGLYNPWVHIFEHEIVERIRSSSDAAAFQSAFEEGRRMSFGEAVALARQIAARADESTDS